MPVVDLPDELIKQLNDSETQTINSTEGSGVAVYWSSDRTVRADIFVGLKLDGFSLYDNISSVDPDIKMQFSIPPPLFCQSDAVDFDPSKEEVIIIKVSHRLLLIVAKYTESMGHRSIITSLYICQ